MERIKGIKILPPVAEVYTSLPRCLCCFDSGLASIPADLYDQILDGEQSLPFICRRPDCEAGRKQMGAWMMGDEERKGLKSLLSAREYQAAFDTRLDPSVCEAIHLWQVEQFKGTEEARSRNSARVRQLVNL